MSRLCTLVAAATLLASACGGTSYKATYKPTVIKAEVREQAPPPVVKADPAPIEPGTKIEISDNIHFHSHSARIRHRSYRVLDEVVTELRQHPDIVVEIQGHTDSYGTERGNRHLSARRAESVQEYLIRRGIDPRRVSAVGHGETRPVANNETRQGRYSNRRVDFIVTGTIADLPREPVASRSSSSKSDEDEEFDVAENRTDRSSHRSATRHERTRDRKSAERSDRDKSDKHDDDFDDEF
jgi:OOP family OmpA-OmpF porin